MAKPKQAVYRGSRGRRRAVKGAEDAAPIRFDPLQALGVGLYSPTGRPLTDLKAEEVTGALKRMKAQSDMYLKVTAELDALHKIAHDSPNSKAGDNVIAHAAGEINRLRELLRRKGYDWRTGKSLSLGESRSRVKPRMSDEDLDALFNGEEAANDPVPLTEAQQSLVDALVSGARGGWPRMEEED